MNRVLLQTTRFNGAVKQTVVGIRQNGTPIQLDLSLSRAQVQEDMLLVATIQYISQASTSGERTIAPATQAVEPKEDGSLNLASPQRRFSMIEQLNDIGNKTISVSHDFNSPVFGVRKLLQHLRGFLNLTEHQKVLFDLLERKCRRIGLNIQQLKEFYRPQSGIGGPLNINEILEDILVLNRPGFENKHIKLEKHFTEDLPNIDAVSDQMHQALQNLIRHSEESLPEAGGEIMIATELEATDIKIYILDSGNPMAPGYLESICDPVSGPGEGSETSRDLPLQYSINIIKTHGGSIEVSAREGKGNIYTVTLPLPGNP